MHEQEQHEMQLESISSIGTEEWFCPICERRLLKLNWHPDSRQIVVQVGNENADHSHEGDSLRDDRPSVRQAEEAGPSAEQERRLGPWLEWMEEVDFDSWWKDNL